MSSVAARTGRHRQRYEDNLRLVSGLPNLEVSAVLHDIQLIISKIFMALAVVGDVAVELMVKKSLEEVLDRAIRSRNFKPTLEGIRSKIERILPLLEEIEHLNYVLGRPEREMKRLIEILEDGNKLICKCSKVQRWNFVERMRYQK